MVVRKAKIFSEAMNTWLRHKSIPIDKFPPKMISQLKHTHTQPITTTVTTNHHEKQQTESTRQIQIPTDLIPDCGIIRHKM